MIGAAAARRGRARAAGRTRAASGAARRPPRLRRILAIAVLVLALLGGGYLWLRDSSLVAVQDVSITGLHGADAGTIRSALRDAALSTTTLHTDRAAIRSAAAPFPVVADLRITTDFPHGLAIHVVSREPVGAVALGGGLVPVAADGTVLKDGAANTESLPRIAIPAEAGGERLAGGRATQAVAFLAAAPAGIRRRITEVRWSSYGLTAELRDGPLLLFGPARRLAAKWTAAAAVLGDSGSEGADYVDVRLPERAVAGGLTTAEGGAPTAEEAAAAAAAASGTEVTTQTTTTTETPTSGATGGATADPAAAGGTVAPPATTTPTTTTPVAPPAPAQTGAAVAPSP